MKVSKNIIISIGIFGIVFLICLGLQTLFQNNSLIFAASILGIILISLFTDGFIYGILSSIISVLINNYLFTYPYYSFGINLPENVMAAIIMIAITAITSTLMSKIKMQEALKLESEQEKMRANLLRAISHDLRTPLTTIYGSSSAILENYETFSDEQKSQMLKVIKEDSQWLVRMVENLLSVTKIDGENLKIIKTPTVLEELLDSVLRKIKSRYPKTIIKLDIPDDFIIVPMDAILIEQVIMNILENAIQHAKGMTEILLKAEISQNKVVFIISDDGCGIPEEKLNNIFKGIFSVTEHSFDNKKRNIGIGLSVCSTIIKAHGGNIYAKNLKKGAEFQFTLDMRE